jgi:outer membrane protein OmpA-like peptidoglycan-associated protein/MFS family permease
VADESGEEAKAKQSSWANLLSEAGKQLAPVLLTGASLIGFVAFAGGVIVWTRFSAAKVPPDQAVNAVPRDELVAIGSAVLLLFGFFGVLALISVFLIDRGGRATPGMARALLVVFLIEGIAAIIIAEDVSVARTLAVAEMFGLAVAAGLWATFVTTFVELKDDLPARKEEREGPRGYGMFLLPASPPKSPADWWRVQLPLLAAVACLAWAVLFDLLFDADTVLWIWLLLSLAVFAAFVLWCLHALGKDMNQELLEKCRSLAGERRALARRERRREESRMLNERPMRLELGMWGAILMVVVLAVCVGLPLWLLGEWWVGVSIGAAAGLAAALWRISSLSAERVIWYGVAVFISVPLFGTLTAMARNIDDPQVQPLALIRNTDGPDEAIQGLYVTEADDRVYFATVATEGCTNELTADSGRLAWVPKSEVVAMSIGPSQGVKEAAASALEMSYALTPAVETPAGAESESELTVSEAPAAEGGSPVAMSSLDKRLEDAGPAVRPFYGAGLNLTPENASPGETVTLRMNAPNNNGDVRGFGRTRNGHTLRIGGVRATIQKEYAHRADTAEYVETEEGMLLRLEKGEPYVTGDDEEFERLGDLDSRKGDTRYFKLVDPRVLSVGEKKMGEEHGEGDEEGIYLPTKKGRRGAPFLAFPERTVTLRGLVDRKGNLTKADETQLELRPKAQAWHEREIKFIVPENGSTGAVTVECSQLAGQPLLRVAHAPEPRISVRMEAGSSRVSFDSSRTSDADEESISRRWNIDGLRRGNVKEMSVDLPPRPRAYTVRMTATDESGRATFAEVSLLRLPASLFESDEDEPGNKPVLQEARETLEEAASTQVPAAIEIDGHADDPGTHRHNVHLSLRRAEHVRRQLLRDPDVRIAGGAVVQVRTLAYGEGCPADPRPGRNRSNRRVDVFVLEQGVSMIPPAGCHPRRLQSTEWRLPAPQPAG